MRVLAVTLARGGSKGVPNKNIHHINGRPLLWYTIKEVKKSKYIKDYYIIFVFSLETIRIFKSYNVYDIYDTIIVSGWPPYAMLEPGLSGQTRIFLYLS